MPPHGAIALGVLPNARARNLLRQPFDMPPDDAEMMRAGYSGGGDAVGPPSPGNSAIAGRGRERETIRASTIKVPDRICWSARRRIHRPCRARLRTVGRHAPEPMALLAVDLGLRRAHAPPKGATNARRIAGPTPLTIRALQLRSRLMVCGASSALLQHARHAVHGHETHAVVGLRW